jgi:molecular chaperone GrpE
MQPSTENTAPDEPLADAVSHDDDQGVVERGESGAQTADGQTEDSPAELTSEEKIERLEQENSGLRDQLLRKAADFDNYRKRMFREKQEAYDYANTALLGDLLDSLDNFDRALSASSQASDIKTLVDGIEMTKKQLVSMLEAKYNLSSYGEAGDSFDPEQHEALASVPAKVIEPVLAEVYLKGYKLKDRVIRHAKVMVNMPEGNDAQL